MTNGHAHQNTTVHNTTAHRPSQLNGSPWAPKRDYTTNRLQPGVLAVAQGTPLVLDETQLQSGQLTEQGVANVQVAAV